MEQSAKAAAARRGVKLDMDGTDAAASREKKVLLIFNLLCAMRSSVTLARAALLGF